MLSSFHSTTGVLEGSSELKENDFIIASGEAINNRRDNQRVTAVADDFPQDSILSFGSNEACSTVRIMDGTTTASEPTAKPDKDSPLDQQQITTDLDNGFSGLHGGT